MATKKTATPETKTVEIKIKAPIIETANIVLVGDSPLIVHAWSEKAKHEMLERPPDFLGQWEGIVPAALWFADCRRGNIGVKHQVALAIKFPKLRSSDGSVICRDVGWT